MSLRTVLGGGEGRCYIFSGLDFKPLSEISTVKSVYRECYFLYLLLSAFLDVPGNVYCARVFVCLPDCDALLCHTAATDEC